MALDYEVRPEYKALSLDKLLDNTVNVFEGVGDTQANILSRYFGVTTLRQLANMPFFLWALGIQEMALKPGEEGGKSIEDLSRGQELKFSVRPNARGKNPRDLLKGPVNVLEGLTPAQNLALYDGFRITNVIQLAHNRIMLEARVIEYLEKHGGEAATGDKAQVASILGADTFVPGSGDEAQQAMAGQKDEGLRRMADEIGEHVRGRLDALRDGAADRARSFASREPAAAAPDTGSVGLRPERPSATEDRLGHLREVRQRTETTRIQTTLTGPGAAASRAAAIAASREGVGTGPSTGGAGMGAGGGLATSPGMTVHPPGTEPAPQGEGLAAPGEGEAAAAELTDEMPAPEAVAARPSAFKPWMAAAAVVLIVLIVALWLLMRGGPEEETAMAPAGQTGESASATGEGTAGEGTAGEGTAGQQGAGSQTEGAASPQSAAMVQPPPPPAPPVKGIHTVRKGESLWRISRREYGLGHLWPKIYDLNLDKIEDPDLIYPDQDFKLPDLK